MLAVLGLGANIGNAKENLQCAVLALGRLPGTAVTAVSSYYITEPVGYLDQPKFHNIVATVETSLSPGALLGACLGIEAALGRERLFKNGPRVIDVDVLLYENYASGSPELTLPHPRMGERAFVLAPFSELFPDGKAAGFDFSEKISSVPFDGVEKTGEKPDFTTGGKDND